MELVLMNPDYTTKQIIDEAFRITQKEPKALKEVIRGYVVECEKVLDQLLKNVANEDFKFEPETKKNKSPAYSKIYKSKTLLQNYALSVIFNLNNVTKPPLNQPDEPIFEETEIDQDIQASRAFKEYLKTMKKPRLLSMLRDIKLKNSSGKLSDKYIKGLEKDSKEKIISSILSWTKDKSYLDEALVREWFASNP